MTRFSQSYFATKVILVYTTMKTFPRLFLMPVIKGTLPHTMQKIF